MSDKCGNCDCADKSQCVKKGYAADIIEAEDIISYTETVVVGVTAAAEHDGNCKCGSSCACTDCTCGL
ncbi:metallothionein-like protein type 3 [Sesamum indicum]|uniref:Metallothionein-like protein type 3 n=1 Tax=Sesamum indicum TaxID=4182 RepID=A0A6I9UTW1_SESIN|nr:metallothionein-like protein type 3 [Sesamum indicum]